jgi:WD40 repeat protein
VRLWSIPDGRPIETLEGRTGPIVNLALSPDGGLISATGPEGTHIWSLRDGRRKATFPEARAIAVAPDGRWLVALDARRQAKLWWLPETTEARSFEIHAPSGDVLALTHDGRSLVTGSRQGGPIEAWAVPEGRLLGTLDGHPEGVRVMAASPDRRRLATADSKGIVNLWDLDGLCLLRSLDDSGINRGATTFERRPR